MTVLQGIPQLPGASDVPAHVVDSQTGVVVPLSPPRDPNVEPGNRTSEFGVLVAKLVANLGIVLAVLTNIGALHLSGAEQASIVAAVTTESGLIVSFYGWLRTKRKNAVSAGASA